jgi:hypothetical protein
MDKNKIHLDNLDNYSIDKIKFQKIIFIYNALEDGWCIKKDKKSYILRKKHENKTKVFDELSLTEFITSHMELSKI